LLVPPLWLLVRVVVCDLDPSAKNQQGSSAPELFTSFAGVAVDSDVGVGTIVGSAVFNILVIVALR